MINSCKQCGANFTIEVQDEEFYKKIDVPAPKCCPECRRLQLMCWRNERTFYQSKCAWCKTPMVSCFSSDAPFQVLCSPCWWGEKFDPLKYGRDFDFNRPFFEQFWEHLQETPLGNLYISSSENSDFSNLGVSNKNCYMVTASDSNQDSFYADNSNNNRDCGDVSFVDNSELIYESVDLLNSYNCTFSKNLKNCNSCFFSEDLIGCSNCVGCIGLQNAQYRIFNQQLSKEEYGAKLKNLSFSSFKNTGWVAEQFKKLKASEPKRYSTNINSEGCTGNYITNSKQCTDCFDMFECQNCRYSTFGHKTRDAYDIYGAPGSELVYQCTSTVESYNIQFCNLVWPGSNNLRYSFLSRMAKNCFGCVSLHKNEYCIFNKQYSKTEYEELFKKIRNHMEKTGEWGEFFPMKYSPWAYNETVAFDFCPISKEETAKLGARWNDKTPGTYGKETMIAAHMADDTKEISDDIIKQVFACECVSCSKHDGRCGRNYKVIAQELAFYRKLSVPFPRKCPTCRYNKRLHDRNPRKLWQRVCMCDQATHSRHQSGLCSSQFETTFSPERSEKILCEECYRDR